MASAEVWSALPNTTWSTASPGIPASSSAARAATTPRSVAVMSFRVPPKEPNGVRRPERNTTSVEWRWVPMRRSLPETVVPARRASARADASAMEYVNGSTGPGRADSAAGGCTGCQYPEGSARFGGGPRPVRAHPGTDVVPDRVPDLIRGEGAAQVGGGAPLRDRAPDRVDHVPGFPVVAEILEHERRGQDRGKGIGGTGPRDVRRGAVDRLEQPDPPGMDVRGRRESEPAGEGGRQVAQDVAEQVRSDDDAVPGRAA